MAKSDNTGLFAFNIKSLVYVSLTLTILHELSIVVGLIKNSIAMGNFETFCEDAPMAMAFFMVAYEFYNIVAQKETIENLLHHIEKAIHLYRPTYGQKTYEKSLMGKAVDVLDRLGLYNIIFGIFCVLLWIIRPLVTNSKNLPFGNPWFPFDYQKYYYYLWVWHGYVGTCAAINTINIHIFYSKIMAVICEQFDVLSHAFLNIDEDITSVRKMRTDQELYQRASKLIKYHQELLICCKKLQNCIGGILACQFCFGISLCFAALATFSITAFSGTFINLLNHILLEISELYIYCWFANKLTEHVSYPTTSGVTVKDGFGVEVTLLIQSQKIKNGVFYSNWYTHDKEIQKLMAFVIMRCDKPVVIRAANMLPVSVGSYIWILQQSYSFFMVLRQVRTKTPS